MFMIHCSFSKESCQSYSYFLQAAIFSFSYDISCKLSHHVDFA